MLHKCKGPYPSDVSTRKRNKHHDFRVSLCSREVAVLVVSREECMSGTLVSIFRNLADIENFCFLPVQW